VVLPCESDAHWSQLRVTVEAGRIGGPLVHAARIAALCAVHGVKKLWTADRDFGRYPGLTVTDPLVG
jgi:predicted nucleic acid-binding protein